jgi:hypothetical protein
VKLGNIMRHKIQALLLLLMIELLVMSPANAAFCSLRDPVSAINLLYGQGYEYRSLVNNVTEQDRLLVKQQLPFTIHQNEVGKHTLYILNKEGQQDGFLQARSEWAKWGFVEIAWAINVDRSIKGFYFQRCRSPECNDKVVKNINKQIHNKNFKQLKALLSDDGKSFSVEGEQAFKVAPKLALIVLHSALKTLAITDVSWKSDIDKLNSALN